MRNFTFSIPTKVHFGRGQVVRLGELAEVARRVLMVYGSGSIKRNGVYSLVTGVLEEAGVSVVELGGVEPNPKIDLIREGVRLCGEHGIEAVLAVGGGSAIDSAKLIAAGACYEGDPWDLMQHPRLITDALPIACVLTLAATGSELDDSTVVSNPLTHEKLDICAAPLTPTLSICDPTFTITVPPAQTAAGAVDIMSHVFECYFTPVTGVRLQAHLCEAVLKTVVEYAPRALAAPDDYDARSNLMWASSLALSGLLSSGAEVKWCVHPIEHELSAFYDITHGVGLAIITPAWMRHVLSPQTAPRFADYGREVWGLGEPGDSRAGLHEERDPADDMEVAVRAIDLTQQFFASLGLPTRLRDIGIGEERFSMMALKCIDFCKGCYVPLTCQDIIDIYRAAL